MIDRTNVALDLAPYAVPLYNPLVLVPRYKITVTKPQAIALIAMFDYWNQLASWGSSRKVAFYVDGDGNFHPHCQYMTSEPLIGSYRLTDELRKIAVVKDDNGNRLYDYDPIAWKIREQKIENSINKGQQCEMEQPLDKRGDCEGEEMSND